MADPAPHPTGDTRSRPRSHRRFLGEILLAEGVITREQLGEILARRKVDKSSRLGRLIVDLGYATEAQLAFAIAEQLRLTFVELPGVEIAPQVLEKVNQDLATKYLALPWRIDGRELHLIMADPTNLEAIDAIAFHTGMNIKPAVAPESDLLTALHRSYGVEEASLYGDGFIAPEAASLMDKVAAAANAEPETQAEEDQERASNAPPLAELVNTILADAIVGGASDIHIEPQEKKVVLRHRVDGMLKQILVMPKRVHNRVVSRIKVISHMDISERRKPQDGRTMVRVADKNYDLRVSTLPTPEGEKIVIRVLVQERAMITLEDLGFEPDLLESFKEAVRRPHGMILVTGPTGSGKTSTLYAVLNYLRSETTNIVTVEDPIEYRLDGITQVAVSEKGGVTFASGLRSILRQDPDVVMVGEIRDRETAHIALQAAQTGHLVLSTLHTNDAPSAVTRLVDMGIPAYLIGSSLVAVLAQRLVRKLCTCAEINRDGTASPKGCEACRDAGYRGRTGVYELMRVTALVRSAVVSTVSTHELRAVAEAAGMASMFTDGQRKVIRRITTPDEVRRVAPPAEAEPVVPPYASRAALDETPVPFMMRPLPPSAPLPPPVPPPMPPTRATSAPAPLEPPQPRPVPATAPPVLAAATPSGEADEEEAAPLRHRRGWAWG
ncbi:MAG TPA: ATPase, T2SS/T4P/T4SS family [Vicinamibacteria bacterium]